MNKPTMFAIGMAALFTSKASMAQTVCYDAITPTLTYLYYSGSGGNLIGDMTAAPCTDVTQIEVALVSFTPGTYNINFDVYPTNCFGCPSSTPISINVPTDGIWIATITPPTPISSVQYFSVQTTSPNLRPLYANHNVSVTNAVNGMCLDFAPTNGCLVPSFSGCGGSEWTVTGFGQTNLLVSFTTTPSPLIVQRGPFVTGYDVKLRKVDAPLLAGEAFPHVKTN